MECQECQNFASWLKLVYSFEAQNKDQRSAQVWFKHWFDHQPKRWDSSNRKVEGRSDGEFGGSTLRGVEEEEEEENEVEIKWKMALFTKNALCQSWKRIDKGKRKKERKERMK